MDMEVRPWRQRARILPITGADGCDDAAYGRLRTAKGSAGGECDGGDSGVIMLSARAGEEAESEGLEAGR